MVTFPSMKTSMVIEFNSPALGIASQTLADKLRSDKNVKMRTFQYYSVASCCVLTADDPAVPSLEYLLETIESTGSCERLCSRTHDTFEYVFNHMAVAMWNLTPRRDNNDVALGNSSLVYIQHLFRLLQQPERFPFSCKQLAACIERSTNSEESLDKKVARMLSALELVSNSKEKAWLKIGGLVCVKNRGIGLLLPHSKSPSVSDKNEDSADDEDVSTTSGIADSKLHVYFPAENVQDTVDMEHVTREQHPTGWVETRLLILLSFALESQSREACAFVAKLFSLCSSAQSRSALDKAFEIAVQSSMDFLPEACGVFAKYGNIALAREIMARWIAHTGKWPINPHICDQLGLSQTAELPHIVFSFPLLLTHECFLKSPSLRINIQWEKWRVFLPKIHTYGKIDTQNKDEMFTVRCENGDTVQANVEDMKFLFEDPALEHATVKDLWIEGICAFKALRGNCNLILYGGVAQFHDEPALPASIVKAAAAPLVVSVPKPTQPLLPKSALVKPVFGAKSKPTPASPPTPAVVVTGAAPVAASAAVALSPVKTGPVVPHTKLTAPPSSNNKLTAPSSNNKPTTLSTPMPLPSTKYKLSSPTLAVKVQSTSTTFPLPAQPTKQPTPQIKEKSPIAMASIHQARSPTSLTFPNMQRAATAPAATAPAPAATAPAAAAAVTTTTVIDLVDDDDDVPPKKRVKPSTVVDLTLDD